MANHSAPGRQISSDAWISRANLQHGAGRQAAQDSGDPHQWSVATPEMSRVIDGIRLQPWLKRRRLGWLLRSCRRGGSQRLLASFAKRLDGPDVDALGSECLSAGSLRGVGEGIVALNTEVNLVETGVLDQFGKRCLQQRARNSASPEVDIVSG